MLIHFCTDHHACWFGKADESNEWLVGKLENDNEDDDNALCFYGWCVDSGWCFSPGLQASSSKKVSSSRGVDDE